MDTKINDAVRELLEQLADRLPKRRLPAYRALADAGETTHLLNELCKILIGRGTTVTPAEKATLTQLLNTVPAGDYDYLSNRDQTLTAIQVSEQPQATTHDDVRALSTETHALLERLADRLPPHLLQEYRTLRHVGEWATLTNELSASLISRQIPIAPPERDALAALLNKLRPVSELAYIRDAERTLTSLNVLDRP